MSDWYIKRGNQIAGPLSQKRLLELISQGQVQKSDMIREGEDGAPTPAGEIPELITEFQGIDLQSTNHSRSETPVNKIPDFFIKLAISGVSIYILIVLVANIYTGIQQAHDATKRTKIKNNLRQIGIALEKYHLKHNREETQQPTSK